MGNGSLSNGSVSNGNVLKSKNAETGEEETSKTKEGEIKKEDTGDKEDNRDEKEEEEEAKEDRVKDCFPAVMDSWFRRKCPFMCCKNPEDSAFMQKWHSVRNAMSILVEHRFFEWFILFVIFASSLTLVSGY